MIHMRGTRRQLDAPQIDAPLAVVHGVGVAQRNPGELFDSHDDATQALRKLAIGGIQPGDRTEEGGEAG